MRKNKPYELLVTLNSKQYVDSSGDLCQNGDEKMVREARKSFLSGHASFSFYSGSLPCIIFSLWQYRLLRIQGTDKKLERFCAQHKHISRKN